VLTIEFATPRYPVNLLQIQSGGEYFGSERRNRPPRFLGLLIASGDVTRSLRGVFPAPGSRIGRVRDGLADAVLRRPLALGPQRWGGHDGRLSLAPSQSRSPYAAAYLRYLFFRWRDATGLHAVGLHTWEPFTETVQTLRALLDRLGGGVPSFFAYPARAAEPGGVEMTRTPPWLLDACRSLRTAPICPRRLPAAHASFVEVAYEPGGPTRADYLSVQWSAPYENQPTRNRPPRFVHLELQAGALPAPRRYSQPVTRPRNGMMRRRDYQGGTVIPLGRPRWGGRNGVLVLGDCFGNHVCFRWRRRRVGYQVDLHGWEPFTQTVAALRAVVSSLPPAG
jgi:hypothetical protein